MKDITVRRPIVWKSAHDTNVGVIRQHNEDSVLSMPEQQFWAVADGMGGYEAGNVASSMIVSALQELKSEERLYRLVNSIEDRILDVNHRILEYADIMLDGRTFGSTVVTLAIKGQVGVCVWAGDSRLYRYRNQQLAQLSRDHSQVQEQIQQGYITAEQAEHHPESNVITRAVGVDRELFVDVNVFRAQLGDIFLLCSDGLYNMLPKQAITDTLVNQPIDQAVDSLIGQAIEQGGDDNISVVLIKGEQGAIPRQIQETG
ncbi:MAG: serine/threonine-protein phosphatase [Gammaproteobacteria bacterium]|nr:serine/threonine-protein phosphatase [Gammaproteobacteria bacterium]